MPKILPGGNALPVSLCTTDVDGHSDLILWLLSLQVGLGWSTSSVGY
jgi:hypothetical protein